MFNWTPLIRCAIEGHIEIINQLLSHPKIDINAKDANIRKLPIFLWNFIAQRINGVQLNIQN